MWSKKKAQRKRDTYYQQSEEYFSSKKEKEYLSKYREIAGEYLEDKELIDLLKKNNFDDELITKELNKIVLGDDFKWKEIKNGKPVTTRSTDQIRKKQRHYKPEKTYQMYQKTEEDNNNINDYNSNNINNKRKNKGSYHKNLNDFYHYNSKKPKRPFQKCIEVPSDYLPMKNSNYNNNNNKNLLNTDNNDKNTNNNKIIPSKSANNIITNMDGKNKMSKVSEDNKLNEDFNNNNNNISNSNSNSNNNKNNIKKSLPINMNINNKIEETKNDEKMIDDEEQRRIILIKGEVFKSLKRLKTNTEVKNKDSKNRQKEIYRNKDSSSEKDMKNSDLDYNIFNQDIKNDKALKKKYLKLFLGNMNHYSKKVENNIKRANSKDSETSEDKSEMLKRRKRNNIPTSNNIIQKKNRPINNNSNINRNLRRAYEIEPRENEIEFDSKVINFSISSCYDNPFRDQYLKFYNEKKKQNPGKIVELIIPQFNNMYMPPYIPPYQYPYMNQNMYMYPPPAQYQSQVSMPTQTLNTQNLNNNINNENNSSINQAQYSPQPNYLMNPSQGNMQLNQQYMTQINVPNNISLNQQNRNNSGISSPINSEINIQMSPQVNHFDKYIGINNPELLSPKSMRDVNSDNIINNLSDN